MPFLRPMDKSDLHRVVKIIEQHDEDDAEAAFDDLQDDVSDAFVLENDSGTLIGVTGFRRVPATENTAWLSWTYLDEEYIGQGLGKFMIGGLLDKLRDIQARKIFVKVSNYVDPDDGPVYEKAYKLYQSLGFSLELTNKDFYDEGEDQRILGLRLANSTSSTETSIRDEIASIRFNNLYEIAETDGAFTFSWIVKEKKPLFGKRSFTKEDLLLGLRAVKNDGGRRVFLTFPSNLPLIHRPLQEAGFKIVGELKDYYEDGVNEMHFVHELQNLT